MTLVGKIFTVLIFVMSICFMTASVMVFATHKNWKQYATNTDTSLGKIGLEKQLADLKILEQNLKDELERYKRKLEEERVARRAVVGSLHARLAKAETELAAKQNEYATLITSNTVISQEVKVAQDRLAEIEKMIAATRQTLRDTEADLDDKFAKVVQLTDDLNQATGLKARLDERNTQLAMQVTRMKHVMTSVGVDEYTPVAHIAPRVKGKVLDVKTDLIEVSLGSDDGMKPGHLVQVYRGNQYLGQATVRTTGPDRAVAQIDKKMLRGPIRKDDNVTTQFK
ncbi:Chromosome partition protein Smc [Anatilimnocola aggregata]|uniref:Chromosome partition protein Smc n=1 Tax=Anatilimnocola aggregata TaxID=2528021 RepID=A0A517YAQ2_9BACT|nr:hypothetical protein [Anatilimnocola aggregata]QDU27271.1 Chromosome partition protein Smc [Anatilimnocola aggregata]